MTLLETRVCPVVELCRKMLWNQRTARPPENLAGWHLLKSKNKEKMDQNTLLGGMPVIFRQLHGPGRGSAWLAVQMWFVTSAQHLPLGEAKATRGLCSPKHSPANICTAGTSCYSQQHTALYMTQTAVCTMQNRAVKRSI